MAENKIIRTDTLTNVGGTLTYTPTDMVQMYVILGNAALAGNWTITDDGTSVKGSTYTIRYNATMTLGAFNITFFGAAMTAEQALKNCNIVAYYNGSAFQVTITPDFEESQIISRDNIVDYAISTIKLDQTGGSEAVTTAKIRDLNITTAKIANQAITTAKLDQTGAAEAVTTATIRDLNVTTNKLASKAVTTAKIDDQAVTNTQIADATIDVAKFSPTAIALMGTCGLKCYRTTILSADVLTLGTIPVKLVDSPGVNSIILLESWWYRRIAHAGIPYATNTDLIVGNWLSGSYTGKSTSALDGIPNTSIFFRGGNINPDGLSVPGTNSFIVGDQLDIWVDVGDPTAGDSDLEIIILYRIVSL